LLGQRPALAHLEVLAAVFGDPQVAATLWPGPGGGARTPDQSLALLESDIAHWDLHGFGPWLFRLRKDDRPAARGGLWRTVIEGQPATEVQYAVVSSLWGQGLATEIARATVATAFDHAGLEELVCFTPASNTASLQVMEKAGFQYSHNITRTGLPHRLYRLSKS
jgi:ribosomal-protein-alanine N-acetyltransferase